MEARRATTGGSYTEWSAVRGEPAVSGNKKIKITFKKRLKIKLTSLMSAPEDTWCWGEVEKGSKGRDEYTEPS